MVTYELVVIAKLLKFHKEPDPHGIPVVTNKVTIEARPEIFKVTLQMCKANFRKGKGSTALTREAIWGPVCVQIGFFPRLRREALGVDYSFGADMTV